MVYIIAGTHTLTDMRADIINIKGYYLENILEIDTRLQDESILKKANLNYLSG